MTLYHTKWCPDCDIVRQKLDQLGLSYESVIVPDMRPLRTQVFEASGQYFVPVLVDQHAVLTETEDILAYLESLPRNE